jgi:lipoprotein signal peptidase
MNLGVGRLRTGIFNAADVEILAGITLLLLQALLPAKPSANLNEAS